MGRGAGNQAEADASRAPACPPARVGCALDIGTDELPWYDWGLAPWSILDLPPCPSILNRGAGFSTAGGYAGETAASR